jgi:RNA polymerase sigma-70 factor (ECF subfamily)
MDRGEILALLRERIAGFAASRIGKEFAEDLAQDVLIVLEERYRHVESLDELMPLSLQILRFKIMAHRRRAVRHGEASAISVEDAPLADLRPDPEAEAQRQELLARLARAVPLLGDRCRELLRLKLLGKTFAEIQEEMGAASINTVYTWDLRCRQKLLQMLGGKWSRS